MAGAETIISLGVIVVMTRAGQALVSPVRLELQHALWPELTGRVLADKHPVLTPSPEGHPMLEANQSYLPDNSSAMTRR
jgi:hypothetical protein